MLALFDPLIRRVWGRFGIGNVVELRVQRRDGPGERSRLVGLLRAGDGEYLGHPKGHVGWTRDLAAAGRAVMVRPRGGGQRELKAAILPPGEERDAAIRATSQHPFPGNLIYRLGRGYILQAGVFFRVSESAEQDA